MIVFIRVHSCPFVVQKLPSWGTELLQNIVSWVVSGGWVSPAGTRLPPGREPLIKPSVTIACPREKAKSKSYSV